jgi:hypothetical protein
MIANAESTEPAAPALAVDGRRKSGSRKPRKKPLVSTLRKLMHYDTYPSSPMRLYHQKTRMTTLWSWMLLPSHLRFRFVLVSAAIPRFMIALAPHYETCLANIIKQHFVTDPQILSLCSYESFEKKFAKHFQLHVRRRRQDNQSHRKSQHPNRALSRSQESHSS